MPTMNANRWEASPDGRLPPAPATFHLLLDGPGIVDGLLLKPFNREALKENIEMANQPRFRTWTS